MQTRIDEATVAGTDARVAEAILRSCVHCGFCNATCPTYRLLGNELDGPRGRIYLMKQMLEGVPVSGTTVRHLDRCLTCRACETTCPSGVAYSSLLDIGRSRAEQQYRRPWRERVLRRLLRAVLPSTQRVRLALRLAPFLRGMMPAALAAALPARRSRAATGAEWPRPRHARRIIILQGCVQTATHPGIDAAAARVLDRRGISLLRLADGGCCGAVDHHLAAAEAARSRMIRNLNAWWPAIEAGAEAIISTSSACTAMLKDYGRLLGSDPEHGQRALRTSGMVRDIGEVLASLPAPAAQDPSRGAGSSPMRIAYHAPCSLQHGLRAQDAVASALTACGYELEPVRDAHLCCGAAGTYSILQPELSTQLRRDKIAALQAGNPSAIATANIGCLIHLVQAAAVPVRHWIELVDEAERNAQR
ncbi:MAG: glycolate oxidase subunit GlcF [Gammaproteobacteria bacterium]|nr:glycolate oxidase subunit GlcF [Gammaproteobacteria bacterium]